MILVGWLIVALLACSSLYDETLGQNYYSYGSYGNNAYDYSLSPPYPYYPNYVPVPVVVAPPTATANDKTNGTSSCVDKTSNGNSLYLLVDPKTQRLSIQVTPPCNQTNGTGGALPPSTNGTGSPSPSGPSDSGVCSTITLIKAIIDGLVDIIRQILSTLLETLLELVSNLLNTLVIPLLDSVIPKLETALKNTLTAVIEAVKGILGTTLNGLLGSNSLVDQLLSDVDTLLEGQPGGNLANLTVNVNNLLNDTLLGLLDDVETLVNDLFDPQLPDAVLPTLLNNVTTLLNTTLQTLLGDVNATATQLLNETLGNQSLVTNLTTSIEILLTDVLNLTICDLQILFNETDSITKIIANIETLIEHLLEDVLNNLASLLSNLLKNVLGADGILQTLLDGILKLLKDVLAALFGQRTSKLPLNDANFKTNFLDNVTQALTALLTAPLSSANSSTLNDIASASDSTPSPTNVTSPALIPEILELVEKLLDQILGDVDKLVQELTGGTVFDDPLSALLKDVENVVKSLLDTLLGKADGAVQQNLTDPAGLIDLPALTGPIGTLLTDVLRSVFQCNVSCGGESTNNTAPTEPPPPPATTCTPPTLPPCNCCPPFSNPDCSSTADQFTSQLQQYESTITQQFYKAFDPGYSPSGVVDSLLNANLLNPLSPGSRADEFDDSLLQTLPDRLLQGVSSTIQFTGNAATNGLLRLVNSVTANANSSDSLTLPIL